MWIDFIGCGSMWIFIMDIVVQIIKTLINHPSSTLTAVAGIWVAITASRALHTWKYQLRAEKHIQFMDKLTDTVHEYIQAMSVPIQKLEYIEMAIEAHADTASVRNENSKNAGVISYIVKYGKADQTQLFEYLNKVGPIKSRMESLATKGQVMGFENYRQCYNACTILAWSYGQIEAVAGLIGSEHLNGGNKTVQQVLDKVMTVKSSSVRESLGKHNQIFLEFVKQNYKNLSS